MNDIPTDWLKIAWSAISGVFMTILGYFIPIQNIVLLLILFFAINTIFGYLKAHKIDKEKFSQKKIWNTTIPRLGGSILIVMMSFLWDDVHGQSTVATYNAVGWFLSGILLFKTALNLYYLTKWNAFKDLANYFGRRSSESGIEVTEQSQTEKA